MFDRRLLLLSSKMTSLMVWPVSQLLRALAAAATAVAAVSIVLCPDTFYCCTHVLLLLLLVRAMQRDCCWRLLVLSESVRRHACCDTPRAP